MTCDNSDANATGSLISMDATLHGLFRLVFRPVSKQAVGLRVSQMTTTPAQEFQLKYVTGDLFSCPPQNSLAHCVSQDLHMSKGIATLFKSKFQGLNELRCQGKGVGDVAVLERDGRFIYYLITKPRYFNTPTYSTLQSSLEAMKSHCKENQVTSLAMPKIACGLDKLEWDKVSTMLKEVFSDTAMTITVYMI